MAIATPPANRAARIKRDRRNAEAAYDAVADAHGGRIPSLDLVIDAWEMDDADLPTVIREYKALCVHSVDKRKISQGHSAQMNLFSGELEALDGYLATSDRGRVRLRYATAVDWADSLGFDAENISNVVHAYQVKVQQHSFIAAYLAQGMNTEEAVAAYRHDHP